MVPRETVHFVSLESAVPWGNIEILWKQNELFPEGPVIKCLMWVAQKTQSIWRTVLERRPYGPNHVWIHDAFWTDAKLIIIIHCYLDNGI